jgi:hypothetical protein
MNARQRCILIAAAVVVALMLLMPPFNVDVDMFGSRPILRLAYHMIFNGPQGGTVDVMLLLAQWIAVGIVGAIAYFISADKKE